MADREDFATAVGELISAKATAPPRTVALDTDGTPYWTPTGTHYLAWDVDGTPYYRELSAATSGTDTDGTPYLTDQPTPALTPAEADDEYAPLVHTHSQYLTAADLPDPLPNPGGDPLAGPVPTPAWASGASAHTFDPVLHLYNGESPALDELRAVVRDGGHIVYIGDSKTQGQGSTSWHTEEDAPSGVFQRLTGARPGVMFLIPDAQREQWRGTVGFADSPGLYGMPKEGATSSTVHLKPGPAHTAITWWARGVDGAATVTPTIDGAATAPVTIPQGGEWTATRIEHPDESAHTYQWATTDRIDFLGVAFEYATPGLTITNAGRAASRMDHGGYGWRQSTDPGSLWHQALRMVPVDGVIVQLGTNRAVNPLTDGYGEIAALGHPWAITVPGCTPDDTDRLARIAESYTLAGTHDVPLIDHRHLLGNEAQAASRDLAQIGSLVHENSRGYRLEGVLHHRILNP